MATLALDSSDVPLPSELQQLSTVLDAGLEQLAISNPNVQSAALKATKHIFDLSVRSEASSWSHIIDLISGLAPSQAPQTRSKAKAAETSTTTFDILKSNIFTPTPINNLFVDDMDDEQIWAQLDLRTQTMCRMLDFVLEGEAEDTDSKLDSFDEDHDQDDEERLRLALEALQAEEGNLSMSELLEKYGYDEEDLEEYEDDEDDFGGELELPGESGDATMDDDMEENISPLRDTSSNDNALDVRLQPSLKHPKKRKLGGSELDDGFFDLVEFNADTERAEARSSSRGRLSGDDEEDEDEPIDFFSNIDAMEETVDEEADSKDLFYKDFFEPLSGLSPKRTHTSPNKPQSAKNSQVRFHEEVRVKKIKPTGKNRSLHDDDDEDEDDGDDFTLGDDKEDEEGPSDEDDLPDDQANYSIGLREEDDSSSESEEGSEDVFAEGNAIQRLKQDLFADENEDEQDDMTTHERRMATLREQIKELESENVAQKDWTLMGEAGSRQRPQNSLLEEDLDFDRVRKAVPVITEEEVKSLEETIKARILEGRFDDVVRIRAFEDKPFLPSKFFELQDAKSKESLAQIYENDFLATQPGGKLPDDRDGKLQKEHDAINALWEKICGKLDALSNAHFVPKQPKATISTVTNAPTVSIESTLPTSKSATSMLAPEEVFSSSPSALKVRSEMTPTEKRAARSKDKKSKKKQRDALEMSVNKFVRRKGTAKQQKKAALESLVKQGKGVTVVGKESVAKSKRGKK
ncbi:U3 small nucleolar ribonucleoprotein complex, subunit Mpp10 [Crepidotus variabilis]|uniref:U3 small nucleolar ribonucleoprotein protein MPP10 n=1 Tax=Crepidotus variabilis TaxID=179855 RepID=A0A9P6JN34_9AGAR|nr:U3 small nucleolar ribonucleoprotein complex, subunit Mpp10 [Crepidotus variabilis]